MYQVTHGAFRTPRGQNVTMAYRQDSSDWNTLFSCMNEDEYRLKELTLTGTALDVGAHIGGVAISLALDNPELRVVAIEAVPPNVVLLRENVLRAGVGDRVTVLPVAAGKGKTTTIRWAFKGNESADHHAFIGNSGMADLETVEHLVETVPVRTLASLVKEFGPFSFAKSDCEGCEFPFWRGRGLKDVALIRGEVHSEPEPLISALIDTHHITTFGQIPAAFEAVRRA